MREPTTETPIKIDGDCYIRVRNHAARAEHRRPGRTEAPDGRPSLTQTAVGMSSHQELVYSQDHDYRHGSPHLKHLHLYDRLVSELRKVMRETGARADSRSLLDVGAGEGSFVEPALAHGYHVTATEMSRYSLERLNDRYGENPNFVGVFDEDGSLAAVGDAQYSVVLFSSALHHIPDYLKALNDAAARHLRSGGALVTLQDPLWYPSVPKRVRILSEGMYLMWRLSQGNYRRGVSTRLRRLRGKYNPHNPSDTVEYHVVRNGVDHEGVLETLRTCFDQVTLITYWSTQSRIGQWLGERIDVSNTFALVAQGYDP